MQISFYVISLLYMQSVTATRQELSRRCVIRTTAAVNVSPSLPAVAATGVLQASTGTQTAFPVPVTLRDPRTTPATTPASVCASPASQAGPVGSAHLVTTAIRNVWVSQVAI